MQWFYRAPLMVLLLLVCNIATAQISAKDEYLPHEPIVVGCDCVVPKNGSIHLKWKVREPAKYEQVGNKLFIWAPPGQHEIEATVVTHIWEEVLVLIPDPTTPSDLSKATTKKLQQTKSIDLETYEKLFSVKGKGPTPTPTPTPTPDPDNPDPPTPGPTPEGFAGEVQGWMKALPPGVYSKVAAVRIADAYESVAAQAVATSGMDLASFTAQTKATLMQSMGAQEHAAWTPVFRSLSEKQSKLFAERGLKANDKAGIAQLWRDTSKAFRSAAW